MALAEQAQLAVRIDLEGNASSGIRKLQGQVNGLGSSLGRVGKGVGQVGAGLVRAGAVIGTAVVGGFAAAAKVGGDFEAQLRTINTIAQESDEGLTAIGDGIRRLARDGRGDLEDLTSAYYDLLSAGIQAADAQGVLESATTLAIGGLSTNAEAVDLLTTAINAYGQSASEAGRDADIFAKAIEIGKVTADEIASSFASIAPVAAQTGINIEEVAAAYGALTAQGVPATEVATQMQRAIVELLSPSKELLGLQDKLGVSFLEIAQNDGLVVALQQMRDAVGDDDEAFKALFGRIEGYKFALQTTGPQQEIYNRALAAMGTAAGTAAEQMAERQQGLNFQLARLKANLIDAGLELSAGFLPALARSLTQLSGALSDPANRSNLRSIGEDIGRAIDGIDWPSVVRGAREFATVLKGTLDVTLQILRALNALPSDLKAAALGLLAVNKLSGGLVGQGVGNIVGGAAGVATRSLGSKLPGGVGKLFAQPVFVTNFPPGFGVGGGSGAPVAGAAGAAGLGVGAAVLALGSVAALELAVADAVGPPLRELTGVTAGGLGTVKAEFAGFKLVMGQSQAAVAHQTKVTEEKLASLREAAERTKDDTVAAQNRTKIATDRAKTDLGQNMRLVNSSTRSGSASIVSAIDRIPAPIVNVSVTGNSVTTATTKNGRYGKSNPSRNEDGGNPYLPGGR